MLVIKGGTIYTITQGIILEGMILIENGKILAIGQDLSYPSEAEVIDAAGKVIMPGMIDAHTHLGISEEGIGSEGWDYNEEVDPVTPHLRAIDAINTQEMGMRDALEGGVTTVMIAPGSANVIGGQAAVVKTAGYWVPDMVLRECAGLKVALGENPKRVYGDQKKSPVTRMATAGILREYLFKAQNYLVKKEKAKESEYPLEIDLGLEALAQVLRREIPLRAHAHRADDILTAMRIAEEFELDLVIEHATEGHKIAEFFAQRNVPAVVGPLMSSRAKVELRERSDTTPAVLAKAGVLVALTTDHPVVPIQFLNIAAGIAVREGLQEEDALRAITINPAKILGVDQRVGSLEKGKDADVVILNGHPLEVRTRVEKVLVNGVQVFSLA